MFMAGIVRNKYGDLMIVCWESISIMIDNLITGLAESLNIANNEEIRENLREISNRHMPFFDKIDEMKKAVSEIGGIKDDELREKLLNDLDEIAKKGYEVKEGMEEVRKAFAGSNLSKKDKQRIEKEIKRCEETTTNLYSITIPAYAYKNFMAYVRMEGAQHDITVMELQSGQYVSFYPAQHKELMENAMELATLSNQRHPSVSAVERSAYFGCLDRSKAGILRFENLTPELAEKAVQEANHNSYVNFAKEEVPGSNPPMFNIVCEAGETQEDRNRNYCQAIEILAKSALAVSGPLKDLEEKKMRFEARKFEKLQEGLKSGSGYVFSVKDYTNSGVCDPNEFIRFETDKVNGNGQFFVNINGVVTTTLYESETDRYKDQLYHMAQAGTGDKVYVSDKEMESMKETAIRLYDMIQKMDSTKDAMDFKGESVLKRNEASSLEANGQKTLAQAAKKESKEMEMLARACSLSKRNSASLTKKDILNGVLSEHLSHSRYNAKVNSEVAKNGMLIQKMANWCAKDTRQEAMNDTENRLRMETKAGKEDYSIPSVKIIQELDRFNIDRFILAEYDRAKATPEEKKNPNDICVEDVQKELQVLNQYYPKALEEAKELLADVRVRMISAEVGIEAKDLSSIYTQSNSLRKRELINNIELGKSVSDEAPAKEIEEKNIQREEVRETVR